MADQRTIAFFPEGAFGPALNSMGIAQACTALGHRCVFVRDPGFAGVFEGYGFEEREVNLSEPMPADEQFAAALATLTGDSAMKAKLAATSRHMQAQDGTVKAARLLDALL